MARPDDSNPLRTGIFGIVLVACLVLVSFGYTKLPFWPQGKPYEAYFTDAGGISPGNDVNVSGIKVGKVTSVELAGDAAKVTFTVDRDVKVGDQSLVAIKTDTVLGEKSLAVTPRGGRRLDGYPVGPHHDSLHAQYRAAGSRPERRRAGQAEVRAGAADADRHTARRDPAIARRARRRRQPVAQPQRARRGARTAAGACQEGLRHPGAARRTGEPARSSTATCCSPLSMSAVKR